MQEVTPGTAPPLLEIRGLKTYFRSEDGLSKAVDGVSLAIPPRRVFGLVGESGCGKSVTAMSILQLIPTPPGVIEAGEIWFKDQDLLTLSQRQMRAIRGNQISMIFQEPMTSLNPVFTVGDQIGEVFRVHRGLSKRESVREAVRMLELVKIPAASSRVHDYPHQMSGGMRQRVMIAMALACDPDLLIADEPTTALDVTVQAQVLELMLQLKEQRGSSVIVITHDLGVIAETSDDVAVMYAGQIAEQGTTDDIFEHPLHPYTLGLLDSRPSLSDIREKQALRPIKGAVPSPLDHPSGCRFHPRCPFSTAECHEEAPQMRELKPGHLVRCHWAEEIEKGTQPRHEVETFAAG